MNAINESHELPRAAAAAAPHPTHTYKMLLKREFWEHKGGFLWAPLVATGISLVMTAMALIAFEVFIGRLPDARVNVEGGSFQINGIDLRMLTQKMSAEDLQQMGSVLDFGLLLASGWPLVVLTFVVFFYCLGSLYDDRKDRSVLFWKSMPLSDRDTVLSKVISAVVTAPVIAVVVGMIAMFAFLILLSVFVLFHGGNPLVMLWGTANPFKVGFLLLASLPISALWALPTVGWLMLCSAWARSKPFLWAVIIPVFAGIFVTWFGVMKLFHLNTVWFWQNIVVRGLLSVVPGTWMDVANLDHVNFDGPGVLDSVFNLGTMYSVLLTPQLWIGALVGAAMIFGAIRLRRWRDEG